MTGLLGLIISLGGLIFTVYDHWPSSTNSLIDKNFILATSGWIVALAYCIHSCYIKRKCEKQIISITKSSAILEESLQESINEHKKSLASLKTTLSEKEQSLERSNGTVDYLHRCLSKEFKESPIPRSQPEQPHEV